MDLHIKYINDINEVCKHTDDTVEKAFDKGGYPEVARVCGKGRMPHGYAEYMTPRSYKIWLGYLRWRWCHNHPCFVKMQNKYYAQKRQKEKPYTATCRLCGKTFSAPRETYKICPECHRKPTKAMQHVAEMTRKRKTREAKIMLAKELYANGFTQTRIGAQLGVSQRMISHWVNDK